MNNNDPKGKFNQKTLKRALIIFAILLAVIGVGALTVKLVYDKILVKENKDDLANIPSYNRNETEEEADLNQNIAIFGVDKDGMRTDVIFVVNFNTVTDAIKVIAVPRDTKVAWTSYQQEKMHELGKGYHEYSKITEMSAYGGLDNLRYFTVNTLEDIMGIKIDHYIVVNIDAFRKIVDAIGGVEVNVPRRMEYNDNYQDLHIDLEPGLQVLNGEQAEGLVRWRHNEDYSEQYAEGDVGRIETQQLFLKALAHKVLSSSSTSDLLKIITAVYGDLKTDITMGEAKDYLKYVSQFKSENITFATLPGEAVREDKWYYILNQAEVDAFMQKIMYNRDVPIINKEDTTSNTSSAIDYNKSSDWSESQVIEYIPEYEEETNDDRDMELSVPESPSAPESESETSPEVGEDIQSGEIIIEDSNTTDETIIDTPIEEDAPIEEPSVPQTTPSVETTPEVTDTPSDNIPSEVPTDISNSIETPSPTQIPVLSLDPTLQTTDGIETPIS